MFTLKVGGAVAVAVVAALVGCSASAPVDQSTTENAFTSMDETATSEGRDGVDRRICGPDRVNFCPAGFTCIGSTDRETGHCFKECDADADCPTGQTCRNFDNSGPKEPEYAGHCEVAKAPPTSGTDPVVKAVFVVVKKQVGPLVGDSYPGPATHEIYVRQAPQGGSPAPTGTIASGEATLDQP